MAGFRRLRHQLSPVRCRNRHVDRGRPAPAARNAISSRERPCPWCSISRCRRRTAATRRWSRPCARMSAGITKRAGPSCWWKPPPSTTSRHWAASAWPPAALLRREREWRAIGRALTYPVLTIWRNRGLIRVMVRRDILGRYRGSFGGSFWTAINPLLLMLTYFFVFGIVLHRAGESRSQFAMYFLAGMLPWLAFSEAAGRAPTVMLEHRNFVKKLVFAVETRAREPGDLGAGNARCSRWCFTVCSCWPCGTGFRPRCCGCRYCWCRSCCSPRG